MQGWLSQTLKNLIADEIKSAKHRLELPLKEDIIIYNDDLFAHSFSELLPKGLTQKEREVLILYYENQFTYEQIAEKLHISVLNSRTRLFRAKKHYKELMNKANKT